jgi:hypothetical protein
MKPKAMVPGLLVTEKLGASSALSKNEPILDFHVYKQQFAKAG